MHNLVRSGGKIRGEKHFLHFGSKPEPGNYYLKQVFEIIFFQNNKSNRIVVPCCLVSFVLHKLGLFCAWHHQIQTTSTTRPQHSTNARMHHTQLIRSLLFFQNWNYIYQNNLEQGQTFWKSSPKCVFWSWWFKFLVPWLKLWNLVPNTNKQDSLIITVGQASKHKKIRVMKTE